MRGGTMWCIVAPSAPGRFANWCTTASRRLPARRSPSCLRSGSRLGLIPKPCGRRPAVAPLAVALAALAEQELIEAINRGWGDAPTTKVRLLQEERAGVQVRGNFPAGHTRLVIEA